MPSIRENPVAAHVAPFAAWLLLMHFLDVPQLSPAWAYALRAVLCAVLLAWLAPWRWYGKADLRHAPLALLAGGAVFLVWVGPESGTAGRLAPALSEFYVQWCVLPFGAPRAPLESIPYAPEVCGWPLALARLGGSAVVIAVIEEFFWRGFLYRWMQGRGGFTDRDAGRMDGPIFLLVVAVFGFEHKEWLAGLVAGLAYGWLYVRTRDIWAAALAHLTTNLLLGVYVLTTRAYAFW